MAPRNARKLLYSQELNWTFGLVWSQRTRQQALCSKETRDKINTNGKNLTRPANERDKISSQSICDNRCYPLLIDGILISLQTNGLLLLSFSPPSIQNPRKSTRYGITDALNLNLIGSPKRGFYCLSQAIRNEVLWLAEFWIAVCFLVLPVVSSLVYFLTKCLNFWGRGFRRFLATWCRLLKEGNLRSTLGKEEKGSGCPFVPGGGGIGIGLTKQKRHPRIFPD